MARPLVPVREAVDIWPKYNGTPIGELLNYHNLGATERHHVRPELLIGTCMDYQIHLRIPPRFAYVIRTGGANLRVLEFQLSYAVAVGGVRAVCLVGHDQCSMVDLAERREEFVSGLVARAGWKRGVAEEHFDSLSRWFDVGDPVDFACAQQMALEQRYPRLLIATMMYNVDDGMLYQVD